MDLKDYGIRDICEIVADLCWIQSTAIATAKDAMKMPDENMAKTLLELAEKAHTVENKVFSTYRLLENLIRDQDGQG